MVMILLYSRGGMPMPANTPLGLEESNAACTQIQPKSICPPTRQRVGGRRRRQCEKKGRELTVTQSKRRDEPQDTAPSTLETVTSDPISMR
jgi:hypothetical protein